VFQNTSPKKPDHAAIPDDLFEARIEYTKKLNRGRDLSPRCLVTPSISRGNRTVKIEESSCRRSRKGQRMTDKILHVIQESGLCPDKTVTDSHGSSYIRKTDFLDLCAVCPSAARLLKPVSGCSFAIRDIRSRIDKRSVQHLRYVWTAAVLYEGSRQSIG